MGNTVIILLGYIITFILILVIISLLLRIRKIERKLINFSPTEAYVIMENMREMVAESSRIADSLDAAIKQKEAVLEDLSDLVDEKLIRFERANKNIDNKAVNKTVKKIEEIEERKENEESFISSETLIKESISKQQAAKSVTMQNSSVNNTANEQVNKQDKKSRIIAMNNEGKEPIEIARDLGISVTEVQLALRLLPKV